MKILVVIQLMLLTLITPMAHSNDEPSDPVTEAMNNAFMSALLNLDETLISQEEMNEKLSRSYYCYSVTKGYPEVQEHYLQVMKALVTVATLADQRTTEGMDDVIREVNVSSDGAREACVRKAVFEIIGLD